MGIDTLLKNKIMKLLVRRLGLFLVKILNLINRYNEIKKIEIIMLKNRGSPSMTKNKHIIVPKI